MMKKNKLLMLMALALFLFGCRTELSDNSETNISQSDYRKTVKLKEALAFKNYLTEAKSNPSQVYSKNEDSFSALSDESTVTVIVQNNVTSYSTVIKHLDRSSDVLVYSIDNENKSIGFTAKYTPEDRTKNYQIDNFTGTVEFTSMDGRPMGVKEFSNGAPLPDKVAMSKNSMNKAGCSFSIRLIEVECNGEHHSPSQIAQCTASQKPYYIVEITEVCSGGGQPPKGFPNMGTYDGGGSSTGGGTTNEMSIQDSFNYMLGEAGLPELTADEYTYIQNNQYIGGQLLSYFYNNLNQNNSQFLHWSINYFKNYADPNISPNAAYKQFQNWFLEEPISGSLQNELFEDWADPTRVKPTTKFKNHSKLNGIYNKIKTASNFNQILKNFMPEGAVTHLIFDIDSVVKPDSQAETSEPVNYWIKITFNKNKDWANIPKVVISGTFMHELIHAEILRQLLVVANTNGSINEATLLDYAKNHKHIELFNAYVKAKTNDSDFQHQYMAQKYVTTIAAFLKQVYGNKYTDVEYKTVVWMSSLKGTKAWNLLPQSEKDLYMNTFNTNYWLWEL
jgi:hypothetical protein